MNRLTSPVERGKHDELHDNDEKEEGAVVSLVSTKRKQLRVGKDDLIRVLQMDNVQMENAVSCFHNAVCGNRKSGPVGKQLHQSDLLTDTPVDVVNLHLLIATLLVRITGGEIKLFGRILSLIVKSHGTKVKSLRAMPTGRVVNTQALSIPTTENNL